MATYDKPSKIENKHDLFKIEQWKMNLNGKAVRLPINSSVVRAICRVYKFQYHPVEGYENVSDLMAGYMVFMDDDERDAWRAHGWQMKYAGSVCQASFHIWAKEFRYLPRLYLTSLRLLFPFNAVRSPTRVQWGKENSAEMMFVNFEQFDLVSHLRILHRRDCRHEIARKATIAATAADDEVNGMLQSTQSGRLPGDRDDK